MRRLALGLGLTNRRLGDGSNLNLDFRSMSELPSFCTFSRATTATYFGSDGLMKVAAINAPRFTFDPATLEPLGYLAEGPRTNLLTYSEQFDNAAWTKTRCSITANAAVAPDGATTADKLVEDATASSSHIIQSASTSYTSGTAYTFSFYAKAGERTFVGVNGPAGAGIDNPAIFNLGTGAVFASGSFSASITSVGNGWYRCVATATATGTSSGSTILRLCDGAGSTSYTGNGSSGAYLWGAQLEAASFPSSYIPTTTTALTRNADSLTITGTAATDRINNAEGTLLVQLNRSYVTSDIGRRAIALQNSADVNDRLQLYSAAGSNGGTFDLKDNNISQYQSFAGLSLSSGQRLTSACAYKVDDCRMAANGTLGSADVAPSVMTTFDQFAIGRNDVGQDLFGTIARVKYWPRRLTDAELQAVTA